MSVSKVVVFGATGNTGLAAVETALKQGFQVSVFVRDVAKLPGELKEKVTVFTGSALNKNEVSKAVAGQNAVVVTLGTRNDLAPTTDMSEGTRNIVESMKEHGVKRISVCISAFLFYEESKVPARFQDVTADHRRQANVLEKSELEWIAVCPPHISDDPPRGTYQIAVGKSPGHHVSKFDLADLLLKCVSRDEYVGQMIGLGYEIAT